MASAQAQIEVIVKNLNSLNKLNKTLDKLNRTNEKLIRGINTLTSSIDKLASSNGFQQVAEDAKGAGKEIDNVAKKLNFIDAAIKRDRDAKARFIKNQVETNPAFKAERFVARSFQAVKTRAVRDMALIKQSVEAAKTPFAALAVAAGNFVNVLKQADTAAKRLVQEFNNVILRESLGALERNLNNARTITQELSRDSKLYRKTVEDVIFAEKAVNRELLARKRIVESLTVDQRAFREKVNRTIIESQNRGAFTGSGFKEFSARADRIRLEASTKQERLEATRALKTSKGFVEQRLKENAARKEAMQMADREIDFERRLNEVLAKRQTIVNKLGFGERANKQGVFASRGGIGGRIRGGVSSAFIGGAFPFLFGQGGASAAGGALGGAAGGLLGGGFGFGLSLIGTAIGSKIQEIDDFNKSLTRLNATLSSSGDGFKTTGKDVSELAKRLGVTKQQAIDVLNSFVAFDSAGVRQSLANVFGTDAGAVDQIASARTEASLVQTIFEKRKLLGLEVTEQLIDQSKIVDNATLEFALVTATLKKKKEIAVEEAKRISIMERINAAVNPFHKDPFLAFGKENKDRAAKVAAGFDESFDEDVQNAIKSFEDLRRIMDKVALASSTDLAEALRQVNIEITKLKDPTFQLIEAANAISGAFSESFKGIIRGTMSVQEAFANMFNRIADHFADMAAKMAATQLKVGLLKIFGNAFAGADIRGAAVDANRSVSAMKQIMSPSGLETVIGGSADGRYASRPMVSSLVERGEPEYVIPASKMSSAMQRYSAGARGESVIPGTGSSQSVGGGGGSTTVNYSGPILTFNSEEFVPKSAVNDIISTAARQGASQGSSQTFATLRNSRSARSRIGL